jgi:hypothetical protein
MEGRPEMSLYPAHVMLRAVERVLRRELYWLNYIIVGEPCAFHHRGIEYHPGAPDG